MAVKRKRMVQNNLSLVLGLLLVVSLLAGSRSYAQDEPTVAEVVQILESDQLLAAQPAGLAYIPEGDAFVLLDAAASSGAGFSAFSLYEPATNQARALPGGPVIDDPVNMTYDGSRERLLLLDRTTGQLIAAVLAAAEAAPGTQAAAAIGPSSLVITDRYDVKTLGLQQAAGMTVDPATGVLYILDGGTRRLLRLAPDSAGSYAGTSAQRDGRVTTVDLALPSTAPLRGLAFNVATGHLYVLDPAARALHEVTPAGQLIKVHDLHAQDLAHPYAIVFAPSGDQTDDPNRQDLYVADSGQPFGTPANPDLSAFPNRIYLPLVEDAGSPAADDAAAAAADVILGKVLEIALDQPNLQFQQAAATSTLNLVRTVQTSLWSPSSPDPSGITYNPSTGELIIADGEVDEISRLFTTRKNVYRSSLAGVLQGTMTTIAYSREPTGASYNPGDGHIFYSDDSKRVIFEIDPGSDGQLDSADDLITSFSVTPFAGRDPEDVSYDVIDRALWIIDGLNAEVYHVRPGANNRFDGIPPGGDDVLRQFDTRGLGIIDPEGIYRNPTTGNLLITSRSTTWLWEVTTSGALVHQYDVSAANALKLAGVTLAPGSTSPGVTNVYMVDRAVDNDTNSSENDGRMYEFTLGSAPPATPTAQPGATPTAQPTAAATPTAPPTATPTAAPSATPTAPAGATVTFSPSGDTFVRSDWPNSNYSASSDLRVVGSPSIINTYLQFQVSGLSAAPRNAKVRLYVMDPSSSGGAIYAVSNNYAGTTTPWIESNLRYNNAPPISGAPLSAVGTVASGTWVEFDVTAAIDGNGLYSFAIASTVSNSVFYNATNAGTNTPQLVVTP
jgi:uncharacterized protein YjiK